MGRGPDFRGKGQNVGAASDAPFVIILRPLDSSCGLRSASFNRSLVIEFFTT